MQKEVWLVKGTVIPDQEHLDEAYGKGNAKVGDIEWQFSDGPAGERGSSSDFVDLEEGLKEHSGYIIHWDESND